MGIIEKRFKKLLIENYNIRIKENIVFEKGAIKIMSKKVAKLNIKGAERGLVASNKWLVPLHSFIQLVGRRATKGFVELERNETLLFAQRKNIEKKAPKGHLIAIYKGNVIGICFSNEKVLIPKLGLRKQRSLIGDIGNRFLKQS